jgi:hypothetical protein
LPIIKYQIIEYLHIKLTTIPIKYHKNLPLILAKYLTFDLYINSFVV